MNTLRHVINFRLSIGNNRSSKLPVTSKKIDIHEFNQCHRPLVCELLNSYINKNDEEEVSALNIFRADYNEKDKNHLINLLTIIKTSTILLVRSSQQRMSNRLLRTIWKPSIESVGIKFRISAIPL